MERSGIDLGKMELVVEPAMAMPVYLQLAEKILCAWVSGKISSGELLPSLHELSAAAEVSKRTAEKAYQVLKEVGMVASYKGRGYYIRKDEGLSLLDTFRSMKDKSINNKIENILNYQP